MPGRCRRIAMAQWLRVPQLRWDTVLPREVPRPLSMYGLPPQGSASGRLVHGISRKPRPWIPSDAMQRSSEKRGQIYRAGSLTEGTHEAHRFPCCSTICCPRRIRRTYKGRPSLSAPRTDPCKRNSRTRLLPWVFDGQPHTWPGMQDTGLREKSVSWSRMSRSAVARSSLMPHHLAGLAVPTDSESAHGGLAGVWRGKR